jgi:hypothetical protein
VSVPANRETLDEDDGFVVDPIDFGFDIDVERAEREMQMRREIYGTDIPTFLASTPGRAKVGCWVKAPDGAKYHLVNEQSEWTVVVDCGRVFPASVYVRSGGINIERCCKTCVKIGVRP